jgi:hypothetical protein
MKTKSILSKCIPLLALTLVSTLTAELDAAERVRATRTSLGGKVVKAQISSDGTIHLLLQIEGRPQYAKSTDNGVTFNSPIPILDPASQKAGLEFQVEDFAIGKDGRMHVAMSNNAWKLKLPEEEWGFYYASLESGAKTFSPVRNINRKPSEGFSIAADQSGNISASFLSGKLYSMVSRDNGETFTAYAEPNPSWNPCDCCTTATTYGPDGKLALLYREETDNNRDMYLVLSEAREGSKPARAKVSSTPWRINACPMTYFTVIRTDSGYVAAWPTKGEVFFAHLDKNGVVLPPGEIKTPGSNGMRTGVLALSGKDGATLIAWKKNDVLGWQLYNSEGKPEGEVGSAPSPGNDATGVALSRGNFLLFL